VAAVDAAERAGRKIVVVGQGYVGLPLAMRAVEAGYTVAGFDVDGTRVKWLLAGESYVSDVPSETLAAALATGRYTASPDDSVCADFDVAVVTVPTPLRDGVPDLSFIEAAARTLGRYVRAGTTVVLESTTYPGTTEELFGPLIEQGSGLAAGVDFFLGFSPERIDPGNEQWTIKSTPKLVAGVDDASLEAVRAFYATLVDETVPVKGTREAELAKLIENTFRHVNIALVNEIAMFAGDLGIDVWAAIDAAASKPFGYLRFTPGPGVGGHCLPIDPSFLSWRVQRALGRSFRFVELANDVNEHMPEYVVRRVVEALNRQRKAVNGSRVLLLGLAYKKNIGDARESPAVRIAELLLHLGAEVRAVDSFVVEEIVDGGVPIVACTDDELATADAVVLLTDHDNVDYDRVVAASGYVLDTRRRVAGPNVEYL